MISSLYDIIGIPFGYLMSIIYKFIPNYSIAIIIFTIVTKILLLPVSYKSHKNAARMQLFHPKLQKLQKSYSNNLQKLQKEQQKLYDEEGYNPMSGCFPNIVQMILLFGIIDVIYKPITHILHISRNTRLEAIELASKLALKFGDINGGNAFNHTKNLRNELFTIEAFDKYPDEFIKIGENFSNLVNEFSKNCTIFGTNISKIPSFHPITWNQESIILFMIPIFAGISQFIVSFYTIRHQNDMNSNIQVSSNKGCITLMIFIMPFLSIWWGFSLPAGVGFYWIWSSLLSFLITFIFDRYFTREKILKINEKEKARIQKKKIFEQKNTIQNSSLASHDNKFSKKSRLEMNKHNSDAINEARKHMAEKYGDLYEENNEE